MEPARTADFLRNGLRAIPFGSVVLVVCHESSARDTLLAEMALTAASAPGISARWISLSENIMSAEGRLGRIQDAQLEEQADRQAQEEVPHHRLSPSAYPDFGKARTREEVASAAEEDRLYNAAEKDRDIRVSAAKNRILAVLREAATAPTMDRLGRNSLEELEAYLNRWSMDPARRTVFFVDDLLAVHIDGKRGTAKSVGVVTRHLKDVAVARNVIIVAGAPAPMATLKDRRSGDEVVIAPTAQSLAAYGSPNESADVVIGFKESRSSTELVPVAVTNRYSDLRPE